MRKINYQGALAFINADMEINEVKEQMIGSDFYEYLKSRSRAMRNEPGTLNVGILKHVSHNKKNITGMSTLEEMLTGFIQDFEAKQSSWHFECRPEQVEDQKATTILSAKVLIALTDPSQVAINRFKRLLRKHLTNQQKENINCKDILYLYEFFRMHDLENSDNTKSAIKAEIPKVESLKM